MPGVDGFEVAEFVKNSMKPQPTIFMFTSAGQRGDSSVNGHLGISSYITKPISQNELLEAILRSLGQLSPEIVSSTKNPTHSLLKPTGRRANILLAEDNAVNQLLAIRLLEKLGHSVTLAENGVEAVTAARKTTYDLILMDVQMPQMGGFEATETIRKNEREVFRHTPIVAMTAHALYGDKEKCLQAGMDDYLSKPINVQKLKAVIEKFTSPSLRWEPFPEVPVPVPVSKLNLETVLHRLGGNRELLMEVSTLFLREYPIMLEKIEKAMESRDPNEVYLATHNLKGSVSNFGAEIAVEAAIAILATIKQTSEIVPVQYQKLKEAVLNLIPVINSYVNGDRKD